MVLFRTYTKPTSWKKIIQKQEAQPRCDIFRRRWIKKKQSILGCEEAHSQLSKYNLHKNW